MSGPLVICDNLVKIYKVADLEVVALQGLGLDSVTASEILALLRTLNQQLGLTVIMVTHDAAIAAGVDRTIAIRDGRTSTETVRREAPLEVVSEHALATSAVIGLPSETHRESVVID